MRSRVSPSLRVALALSSLASLCLSGAAFAQAPAKPGAPAPAPAPGAPSPPKIEVSDPLLAPVPVAPHVLSTWREAVASLNSRGTAILLAQQEVLKSEGQRRVALAGALPTITGTGTLTGYLLQQSSPLTTTVNGKSVTSNVAQNNNPTAVASLSATQPVFNPRAWYAIGTADVAIKSAKISAEDSRRTSLTQVAGAIVDVFVKERTAELNRAQLRASLETLELTRRKLKLGEATRLDVLRTEQDASNTRLNLVTGDEALRQSRENLGAVLGTSEAWGVPPTISLNEIETSLKGVCAPGALEDRADIRKARNDIEVARRNINDVWLQFSPTINLSTTLSDGNSITLPQWNIVGVLSVPLWEGGARYGNLKIARANHEEAKINLGEDIRKATVDMTQALRSVSVADQQRVVSTASRDLAVEAAHLAQRAYEVGTGTSFDLVDTQQKARAAEIDLVQKEANVVQAKLSAMLVTANCNY